MTEFDLVLFAVLLFLSSMLLYAVVYLQRRPRLFLDEQLWTMSFPSLCLFARKHLFSSMNEEENQGKQISSLVRRRTQHRHKLTYADEIIDHHVPWRKARVDKAIFVQRFASVFDLEQEKTSSCLLCVFWEKYSLQKNGWKSEKFPNAWLVTPIWKLRKVFANKRRWERKANCVSSASKRGEREENAERTEYTHTGLLD